MEKQDVKVKTWVFDFIEDCFGNNVFLQVKAFHMMRNEEYREQLKLDQEKRLSQLSKFSAKVCPGGICTKLDQTNRKWLIDALHIGFIWNPHKLKNSQLFVDSETLKKYNEEANEIKYQALEDE
jgi:hypothetical protein